MRTCVIITGGSIDRDFCLEMLGDLRGIDEEVYLIAADRGLVFCRDNGIEPDLIVGDFDSAGGKILEEYQGSSKAPIRVFQPEKDWTDTEIAVEAALEEMGGEPGTVWVLGGTGTRLDHVLGNLQVMELALEKGAQMILADPHNRICMIGGEEGAELTLTQANCFGHYLSLVPWGGDVEGLTLEGMKYPLDDFCLPTAGSRGISNEIAEEIARIRFRKGKLLVIESAD